MPDQFVTWELADVLVGEPLPGALYLYIDFRFITYRAEGDSVDRMAYDRLDFKKVKNLFILERDKKKFQDWLASRVPAEAAAPPLSPENKDFPKAKADAHRKILDIFQSEHPDKVVAQTLAASKKLVTEVMKFPFAVKTLAQLQGYSQGTVDHSLNVSILATYLAMQMGYSHALILQHVGAGGLLHDIGKMRVRLLDNDDEKTIEKKMRDHPTIGLRLLESQQKVPNEVKMIIAQHHEAHDGSGYPKGLRGNNVYDLTRIVSIANTFDGLVANGKGKLLDRQKAAITTLDQELFRKFDPQKLEKALKILKLGV
ncbi:MAG TPA: HD domain-containing phosphohydrolase [Bdellovibrionota bacterium]|nr:HD domain-containing phosphohydrolase [Bdellovibrionota bacterium]